MSWKEDFKFGTLVFLPSGKVRENCDILRRKYDPDSAKTCASHITITQPFSAEPSSDKIKVIERKIAKLKSRKIQIGPFTTSPNKQLLWFDVNPKKYILTIRNELHEIGAFRTDLPLTLDFIPHLTISEHQRDPEDVQSIIQSLNLQYSSVDLIFNSISWIIPDDNFVFHEHYKFVLNQPILANNTTI